MKRPIFNAKSKDLAVFTDKLWGRIARTSPPDELEELAWIIYAASSNATSTKHLRSLLLSIAAIGRAEIVLRARLFAEGKPSLIGFSVPVFPYAPTLEVFPCPTRN